MKPIFNAFLPLPPTLNHYYRARVIKGRPVIYKSDGGYSKKIAQFVGIAPTDKRLKVIATMRFADKRKQDLDNRLKALLDALNGRVWVDDSQIDEIIIKRGAVIKGGLVEIEVYELT